MGNYVGIGISEPHLNIGSDDLTIWSSNAGNTEHVQAATLEEIRLTEEQLDILGLALQENKIRDDCDAVAAPDFKTVGVEEFGDLERENDSPPATFQFSEPNFVQAAGLEEIQLTEEQLDILGLALQESKIREDCDAVADPDYEAAGVEEFGVLKTENDSPPNLTPPFSESSNPNANEVNKRIQENKKKINSRVKPKHKDILEEMFLKNRYPDVSLRENLGRELGISEKGINLWFKGRRVRSRKMAEKVAPSTNAEV